MQKIDEPCFISHIKRRNFPVVSLRSSVSHESISCKRICIIGNHAYSLLNFRGSLIDDMARRGHAIFALAPDYNEETRIAVRALGAMPVDFSLSRTGMNPLRDISDIMLLSHILSKLKPDITLGYAIKPVIYGTLAAYLTHVPKRYAMIEGLGYVFTPCNGSETLMRRVLKNIVSLLYSISLSRVDLAFFLNQDDIDDFSKKRIISPSRAFLLGGIGIDLNYWKPMPPAKKPTSFLLIARLLREKGIVEYANAARIIKQKYDNTRFILIGSLDAHPGALSSSEIDAWAKEGILEWIDYVPDLRPYLAQTSVFVLPSYYREGVPRSTQEAMAMARPIITTDSPGCRETVIDGENGFLIPVHDVESLAAAMERFIIHPEIIGSMGLASRKIAEERFNARKINQIIIQEMGLSFG